MAQPNYCTNYYCRMCVLPDGTDYSTSKEIASGSPYRKRRVLSARLGFLVLILITVVSHSQLLTYPTYFQKTGSSQLKRVEDHLHTVENLISKGILVALTTDYCDNKSFSQLIPIYINIIIICQQYVHDIISLFVFCPKFT